MPYSRRDAPNCEWCPYKKNCFYELLGNKDAKKAFREMRKDSREGSSNPYLQTPADAASGVPSSASPASASGSTEGEDPMQALVESMQRSKAAQKP